MAAILSSSKTSYLHQEGTVNIFQQLTSFKAINTNYKNDKNTPMELYFYALKQNDIQSKNRYVFLMDEVAR